jgi:hypothetical protein
MKKEKKEEYMLMLKRDMFILIPFLPRLQIFDFFPITRQTQADFSLKSLIFLQPVNLLQDFLPYL